MKMAHWNKHIGSEPGIRNSLGTRALKTPENRLKTPENRLKTPENRLKTPENRLTANGVSIVVPDGWEAELSRQNDAASI